MSEDSLDELVRVAVDGLPLRQWYASFAIKLWWSDKQRRPRTESEEQSIVKDISERENDAALDLADWEEFFA